MDENKDLIKKGFTNIEKQPHEYFLQSYHHTRAVMGDPSKSFDDVESAMQGLFQDYLRCKTTDADASLIKALHLEWNMRRDLLMLKKCKSSAKKEGK